MLALNKIKIGVIGLGYVGLPVAIEFSRKYKTVGFDINSLRINQLNKGIDITQEIKEEDLNRVNLSFSSKIQNLSDCNVYIVTVPTPIDKTNKPDLSYLEKASKHVSKIIKKGDVVVFESTVYPGVTEDICIPIIQANSGLIINQDFSCGYSPERINPGKGLHKLTDIVKIVSASNDEALDFLCELYSSIIKAGVHRTSSIKVAEAAKVIENTQRDVNIALINELSIIFNLLGLNTQKILEASETKWNFFPFKPGLVGGHCIGVDPYYLLHKSEEAGYQPKIITAGREINDSMPSHIVKRVFGLMKSKSIKIEKSRILLMGITFKEDCPDIRNTRVTDILVELEKAGSRVEVYDPIADPYLLEKTYGLKSITYPKKQFYDCILIAVSHGAFLKMGLDEITSFSKENKVIFDVKNLFKSDLVDGCL